MNTEGRKVRVVPRPAPVQPDEAETASQPIKEITCEDCGVLCEVFPGKGATRLHGPDPTKCDECFRMYRGKKTLRKRKTRVVPKEYVPRVRTDRRKRTSSTMSLIPKKDNKFHKKQEQRPASMKPINYNDLWKREEEELS